ncbi:MAG TPA: IclR family transcriptional regulator [Burkholderiaceae bacterium]|nr:IclR family transcriptional regulator [Burkholderiaceae bacterium]
MDRTSAEAKDGGRVQRGIHSVEVAGRVLAALLDMERPVRLVDLARRSGIAAAKLHRYVISLRRAGLVGQHEASGLYDLGPLARRIGARTHGARAIADVALPVARTLARELGETVFIAELGAEGPVSVRVAIPDVPLAITPRIGSVHSLMTSATGRVFAAWLPAVEREALVAGEIDALPPRRRRQQREEFEAALQTTREQGLAVAIGERIVGINALSAPVIGEDGRIVLALTVIGNAATFPPVPRTPTERALLRAAAEIARRLAQGS